VPAGSVVVVITRGRGLMVSDSAALVESTPLSVTRTVKVLSPAVVGVPDNVPFAASVNPAGSKPPTTAHEYGCVPPDAARACE
jgi:hypothetical protein